MATAVVSCLRISDTCFKVITDILTGDEHATFVLYSRITKLDDILIIAAVVVTLQQHVSGDECFTVQGYRYMEGILTCEFKCTREFNYFYIKGAFCRVPKFVRNHEYKLSDPYRKVIAGYQSCTIKLADDWLLTA